MHTFMLYMIILHIKKHFGVYFIKIAFHTLQQAILRYLLENGYINNFYTLLVHDILLVNFCYIFG